MQRTAGARSRRASVKRTRSGGWVALLGLCVALATLLGGAVSATAMGGSCVSSGPTTTCTYSYTGSSQTFVVPSGVTSVNVTAIGGEGGSSGDPGGFGASVASTLTTAAPETLTVNVGENGAAGGGGAGGNGGGGPSGSGSGGNGGAGGGAGGGGATSVTTGSTLLVVAGGGGGATSYSAGSGGGSSAQAGTNGGGGFCLGGGGQGASTSAVGAGGNGCEGDNGGSSGTASSGTDVGAGGAGDYWGGGGGGGYYGGGGGSVSAGGGGGSSYTTGSSPVFGTDSTGTPMVTISYVTPTKLTAPAVNREPQWISLATTLTDGTGTPIAGATLVFRVGSQVECVLKTFANGYQTCPVYLSAAQVRSATSYTISYAGSPTHPPITVTGVLYYQAPPFFNPFF